MNIVPQIDLLQFPLSSTVARLGTGASTDHPIGSEITSSRSRVVLSAFNSVTKRCSRTCYCPPGTADLLFDILIIMITMNCHNWFVKKRVAGPLSRAEAARGWGSHVLGAGMGSQRICKSGERSARCCNAAFFDIRITDFCAIGGGAGCVLSKVNGKVLYVESISHLKVRDRLSARKGGLFGTRNCSRLGDTISTGPSRGRLIAERLITRSALDYWKFSPAA